MVTRPHWASRSRPPPGVTPRQRLKEATGGSWVGSCQPLSDQKGCGPQAQASQAPVGLMGLGKGRLVTPRLGAVEGKKTSHCCFVL